MYFRTCRKMVRVVNSSKSASLKFRIQIEYLGEEKEEGGGSPGPRKNRKGELPPTRKVKRQISMEKEPATQKKELTFFLLLRSQHEA